MVGINKRICIIASCSQKKLNHKAPAIELNQGQLFRSIKKLAAKNNFDVKILSGKYGLLDPATIIEPYNQKITSKRQILDISLKISVKINQVIKDYDKIIVIMGSNYRKVLEPFYTDKFIIVFDKRGIGGYLQLVSKFNAMPVKKLFLEIEKFQIKVPIENIKNSGEITENV
ncbi:MAG: hypothetical protein U9Q73_01765 [Nanoarchaeota archaeon]|nr:hypothetical protein [Nanoarchaeota archaeon]